MKSVATRLIIGMLMFGLAAQGQAQSIDAAQEYAACIRLARVQPDKGWDRAQAWIGLAGGEPARHCAAVALIGLGKHQEGALRLEELARKSHRAPELRAQMLGQAAQAWLMAGQLQKAYADQSQALQWQPGDPDLLLDRAFTLAELGRFAEAIEDLDKVLAQTRRADALVLRGTANRFLDRQDKARADIEAALKADPMLPEAWLEKGILERVAGNKPAARKAWRQAELLAPASPAAETARRNLERLDLGE
jgi:tetratricopeptide (TPR) repeat protein